MFIICFQAEITHLKGTGISLTIKLATKAREPYPLFNVGFYDTDGILKTLIYSVYFVLNDCQSHSVSQT